MRKIRRRPLPREIHRYLDLKQLAVNRGQDAGPTWDSARKTKTIKKLERILAQMAGTTERCMFCEDSRGVDIEHFWPKTVYSQQVFAWVNLLLVCAGCNRCKGNRFDLDNTGKPLLIDPTAEDPWDFLYYVPRTGNITAKFDPVTGQENPKGKHTTDAKVLPLNIEAVTEGRKGTYRNLRRAVRDFLGSTTDESTLAAAQDELLQAVSDNSRYGMADWCFRRASGDAPEFQRLQAEYPQVWNAIVSSLP